MLYSTPARFSEGICSMCFGCLQHFAAALRHLQHVTAHAAIAAVVLECLSVSPPQPGMQEMHAGLTGC